MRLKNTTKYGTERLRELASFAARGTKDAGTEIHVKNARTGGARGWCYWAIPSMANVAADAQMLITILLPRVIEPKVTWTRLKRIKAKWPVGIPLEDWQDVFVLIMAHEFRHVWQAQRKQRAQALGKKVTGKLEYDCEVFANNRLNEWREHTGRKAVPSAKQPNPFLKAKGRSPAATDPKESRAHA